MAAADGDVVTVRLVSLRFDANDPILLAPFWAAALRWQLDASNSEEIRLVPADGTSFEIRFRQSPGPKVEQNRVHFDLTTESAADQDGTVEALVARGARHIDIGQGPDDTHVVLADPEGNELCIIEPTNNFLATCPRLGAVNCDGTQALGYFWSRALGWPLVWDQDEETAIRSPDGTGPRITWSGPPLMPRQAENRLRFEVAPTAGGSQAIAVERLVALGATPAADAHPDAVRTRDEAIDDDAIVLLDPDGNRFHVLAPREGPAVTRPGGT